MEGQKLPWMRQQCITSVEPLTDDGQGLTDGCGGWPNLLNHGEMVCAGSQLPARRVIWRVRGYAYPYQDLGGHDAEGGSLLDRFCPTKKPGLKTVGTP